MAKKKGSSGKGGERASVLLPMINEAQREAGFVGEEAVAGMSQALGMSVSKVYGVVTFYSFVSTAPQGRHVIRICKSVPCCLQDAEMMIACIEETLGIGPGETTPDGRFSLELTNCIGACDQAPAMLVDDEVHGELTPEKIGEILRSYD